MNSRPHPGAGHRRRLRDKFGKSGLDGLHDYEAVELLLTFAIPRKDVKPEAKELLRKFGSIKGLVESPGTRMKAIPGIGRHSSDLIRLVRAAAWTYLREAAAVKKKINAPGDVVDFLNCSALPLDNQSLIAVYLNTKNEVLGVEGLLAAEEGLEMVRPKEVLEKAFGHNARSVIFVHPTHDKKPAITKKVIKAAEALKAAAEAVDIIVHDHIVVGNGAHVSGRDSGAIK